MSESQRRSTQQLFAQAKTIHASIRTNSSALENKLQFMRKKIQDHSSFLSCGFCTKTTSGVEDAFKRAFKTLSLSQQVILLWRTCIYIKQITQNKSQVEEQKNKSLNNPEKQMLDTTIYIKEKSLYKAWTVTRIKANIKTRKITITDKSAVLDMHNYLVRSCKNKEKECFALEATNPQQPYQTIKISNEGHSYQETKNFFKKIQKKALRDQVAEVVNPAGYLAQQSGVQLKIPKLGEKKTSSKVSSIKPSNQTAHMYQKMMTLKLISPQYSSIPLKTIQREMIERQRVIRLRDSSYGQIYKFLIDGKKLDKLEDTAGFQKIRSSQCYETYYNKKQQKVKKLYKIKCSQIIIFDWVVDQLNNFSNFKRWKPKMQKIQCLKYFPSQKTRVFHQICKHQSSSKLNYVYIRHHFQQPSLSSTNLNKKIYYYYDQSIIMPVAKSYFSIPQPLAEISYVVWKFQQLNDVVHLTIEAKMDHFTTPENNLKMIENFLGEFELLKNYVTDYSRMEVQNQVLVNTLLFENQYIQKIQEIEDIDHDTEFFTITDTFNEQRGGALMSNKSRENSLKGTVTKATFNMTKKVSTYEDFDNNNRGNLLKFRHPVNPFKKGQPKFVNPTKTGEHFHWQKQWIINPKGQLINTNKQKIQAQNSVLKVVFKRLGRNLLSGKGILAISMPVDVFGDDSNLSRLCNAYGYAPVFLQQASKQASPLQRFKKVIAFAISATIVYIRMDKPFNPILGETYQSLVDGCPVYGEQISHHPPISAVFVKGRGYTLFGHLEAKVELSLNSASGINDGEVNISFNLDNYSKNVVKYTTPPGELKGIMYGDRVMTMIKKSLFYDEQNGLFCELRWGKQKGKSQFSNKFNDAVQGQIVKLKSSFNPKQWKSFKKDDIESQNGLINGRWTGAVFYDKQPLFDTYKIFPYQTQIYEALLDSDVSKRKDLILRSTAVDMELAQLAKEELQEIQRRDRKLRAQNGGKKH